ncbi:class I SAM-dependent methyltransferase [candidate division WOR-3 bacterium]|nr:class I SAM-dependent methyltransferase [candidate division WOR-3 bacterium]
MTSKKKYRTDYLFHDSVYGKIKSERGFSWGGKTEFLKSISILKQYIADLPANAKILEIGCGNGVVLLWLAKNNFRTWGVDISPTAISWAKELSRNEKSNCVFTLGCVTELEKYYEKEFFDFVIDGYCLHCVIGEDRKKLLCGVNKVLKKRGKFFVQTMCNDPVEQNCLVNFDIESRCIVRNGIAGRYFGKVEDIKKELFTSGFTLLSDNIEKVDQDTLFALCIKKEAENGDGA